MNAAVDDIHHRQRQDARRRAADIAIERQARRLGGRLGDRQRDAEDRIGAELRLVRRAVERDHRVVDQDLVFRLEAGQRLENIAIDRLDRLEDALAAVARLVAVAQFDRLMRAGRGAGGNGGAAHRPVFENDLDLDGGIAAAVENFPRDNVDDGGHVCSSIR